MFAPHWSQKDAGEKDSDKSNFDCICVEYFSHYGNIRDNDNNFKFVYSFEVTDDDSYDIVDVIKVSNASFRIVKPPFNKSLIRFQIVVYCNDEDLIALFPKCTLHSLTYDAHFKLWPTKEYGYLRAHTPYASNHN